MNVEYNDHVCGPEAWNGTGYFLWVAKGRLLTQSCSLLKMARALTRQHCDAHHDQYAAERSQNKLLTIVSLWPELGPATTVARAGWVPECHPKSCGMLGNLNYRGTRDRTITSKRAVGELSVRLGVRTLTVVEGLFCSK